jgi:hypothetical protein
MRVALRRQPNPTDPEDALLPVGGEESALAGAEDVAGMLRHGLALYEAELTASVEAVRAAAAAVSLPADEYVPPEWSYALALIDECGRMLPWLAGGPYPDDGPFPGAISSEHRRMCAAALRLLRADVEHRLQEGRRDWVVPRAALRPYEDRIAAIDRALGLPALAAARPPGGWREVVRRRAAQRLTWPRRRGTRA